MVIFVKSPNRSIHGLARQFLIGFVIPLLLLSRTGLGQTQQSVLGTAQIQNSLDSNSSGMAEAFPVTANSSSQVNSLSVFLDSSNTAGTVWVGVYTNYYGHPNKLLGQAVIQQPAPGRWNSVQIPTVQVKQWKRYWIALLGLNGKIEFRDSTSNWCYSETSRQTTLTSLPTTWSTSSQFSTCVVSMFGSGSTSGGVSLTVSPNSASLRAGQQTQFTTTVSGTTNTAVTWTASGGTVTSGGQYTAPSSAGTYTVTATSVADATKFASAVVTVSQPTQVSISVSPVTTSLQSGGQQQFKASVSGTSNTGVAWSASGGTVTTSGLYTAPSSAGTYAVTATSVADATKFISAVVTVSQPTQISISMSPVTASLQSGGQQQFVAYVSGTSHTAVTWSASGGTVTTSGLYTAPSTAGNYTVIAVSAADSTKSASAGVSVSAPQTIAVSIAPKTVAIPEKWQQQFAATVSGSSNTGVTWAVTQGTGTITQSGVYTAPQSVETEVVTATSQADSTKSASATITVAAPHSVSLSWLASSSSSISYYNVYRGTVSGGPYSLLKNGVSSTSYTDSNVQSGSTYYYVTTAVDSTGTESGYSDEAQALIPMP
jgi:hypothetical protein